MAQGYVPIAKAKLGNSTSSILSADKHMDKHTLSTNRNTSRHAARQIRLTFSLALLTGFGGAMLSSLNSLPASAEIIYRIENKDGSVVFTDTPPANQQAETVELSPTNTQPRLVAPKATEVVAKPDSSRYTRVALVQPTNDLTIPPGQLDVVVQVALEPELQESHRIQFVMDGRVQGKPVAATSISIGNLVRGTHTIRAQVVDQNNAVIASSGTATIHVKRHSANKR